MDRLTEAERILKYGLIPEEEEGLLAFCKQHKVSTTWYFIIPYMELQFFPMLSAFREVKGERLLHNNKLVLIRIQYFAQGQLSKAMLERTSPLCRAGAMIFKPLLYRCKVLYHTFWEKKSISYILGMNDIMFSCHAEIMAHVLLDKMLKYTIIWPSEGVNEFSPGSGCGAGEHPVSGGGDPGLLLPRLHNHPQILDQCH